MMLENYIAKSNLKPPESSLAKRTEEVECLLTFMAFNAQNVSKEVYKIVDESLLPKAKVTHMIELNEMLDSFVR